MQPITLFNAGSLRAAMEEIAALARRELALDIVTQYGPSGILRQRIEAGERADILASADMGHPKRLFAAGLSHAPVAFAGNTIRIMLAPGRTPPTEPNDAPSLVRWLLDASLRLATSTPVADPSGDYAWQFFDRAETVLQGAAARLKAKAVQAVGGADPKTSQYVDGKSPVARLFLEEGTDAFIGYATSATQVAAQVPGLTVITPPTALAMHCVCGMAILQRANDDVLRLARMILAASGRAILARHGFEPPHG